MDASMDTDSFLCFIPNAMTLAVNWRIGGRLVFTDVA